MDKTQQALYQREVRKRRKENHECLRCGIKLGIKYAYSKCTECRKKDLEYWERRKKELISKGLCMYCSKRPRIKGKTSCIVCNNYKERDISSYMFTNSKSVAYKKGIKFSITKEDIKVPERCPLLGIKLKKTKGKLQDSSPSLDRIDNSKGYVPGNVWVISYKANRMKSNSTLEEMEKMVKNWKEFLIYN